MFMMLAKLPKPNQADVAGGIRQILRFCASQGVTSLREAATGTLAGVAEFAMLHQLNGAERLPVRVSTAQFAIMAGKTPAEVAAAWKAAGLRPSLHSDYNVTKVHPLQSARTAVLRQLQVDGTVLNPAECATPAQALAAITSNRCHHPALDSASHHPG
jgi:predicted amidohydrolase YtcJ